MMSFKLFKLFRKVESLENVSEVELIEEEKDVVDFVFSKKLIPENYQNLKLHFNWIKLDGEFVKKGQWIADLTDATSGFTLNILAEIEGFIEIFKPSSSDIYRSDYLEENDLVYKIYKNVSPHKLNKLKEKRHKSYPIITKDAFSNKVNIEWAYIGGQGGKPNKFLDQKEEVKDFFCLPVEGNISARLCFSFINIQNSDFIVFRYPIKYFKFKLNTIVSFMFQNGAIINFKIINKPYKHSDNREKGILYEFKIPLTTNEINIFKTQNIKKWQVDYGNLQMKIDGSDINSMIFDYKLAIKQFANDYTKIVEDNIPEYVPLLERNELKKSPIVNEECYVYLMIDLKNKYHKIGISNKPEYREKTLQSEKPTIELVCNKIYPSRRIAKAIETAFHQTYGSKRIRGEWFNLSESEVKELKETLNN